MARTPLIAALLLLLAGCKLIDQTTFNPNAGKPPAAPAPIVAAAELPLITIDFSTPDPVYDTALRLAVSDAVSRKPDVIFDVTTVVPATGTPADQVAAATALSADARLVARTISSEDVNDDQVHLSARSEAGLASRQIRVYVH
ncbi:MAG: hypothetical protein WDN49_16285 [Acetobacteraceae bacterium]